MPRQQPYYVGQHHPDGQAIYDRFLIANPNLRGCVTMGQTCGDGSWGEDGTLVTLVA
jgi:hypothetical protein